MKLFIQIALFGFLISFFSCTKSENWGDPTDDVPPGVVSDVEVENLHGGARITYNLPADKDLLGVKAVYSLNEEELESFSSAFKDTIEIYGFADTEEREIRLVSVDKSRNESEPLIIKIQPLTPPVQLIRESLEVDATFGGVMVTWNNPTFSDFGIILYKEDSISGDYEYDDTYFTNVESGQYVFRGYDSSEKKFRIQLRDKWDNYSSVKDTVLTPLFEEQIPSKDELNQYIWNLYSVDDEESLIWRGDVHNESRKYADSYRMMMDGNFTNWWNTGEPENVLSTYTGKSTDIRPQVPMYFTIDLGKECYLSRHVHYHRHDRIMRGYTLKSFEIWASNEPPRDRSTFNNKEESLAYWTSWEDIGGTDAWKNDWVKIAECNIVPPSGATTPEDVTQSDVAWGSNGYEFSVFPEQTSKSFRYLRFVSQRNWGGSTFIQIGELEFYGQVK